MSEARRDILQVRASRALRKFVKDMKDAGQVAEQVDAYRLCIAVAIAVGRVPDLQRARSGRDTMFAANTLDTDTFALRTAISEMYPEVAETPYRAAEALAEEGATVLKGLWRDDEVRFSDVLDLADRGAEFDAPMDDETSGEAETVAEDDDDGAEGPDESEGIADFGDVQGDDGASSA